MQTYHVYFDIEGGLFMDIEAESVKDAGIKAMAAIKDVNMGKLTDVNANIAVIENKDGRVVYDIGNE